MSRAALITGGSRGIGLGIAQCLAAEGINLAINGLRPATDVVEVIDGLRSTGVEADYFQADISGKDERDRLVSSVMERFGKLDVLVNNAGVAPNTRADILEAGEESFERLIRTNLQGPYFLTQVVANEMIKLVATDSSFRCIVNITSVSSFVASVNRGDYCLTKAALSMSTKLWATRLAEFGISVFEVQPGIIQTDMTAGVQEKYDRLIEDGLMLQPRWGTSEDVGKAVAMLVRGDMPYSTGAVLRVDGGFSVERL